MPQETVEIPIEKSPHWRAVSATYVAMNVVGASAGGLDVIMRFSYEWVNLLKERFIADVTTAGQGQLITVVTPLPPLQTGIIRIEEVATRIPLDTATTLVATLLTAFSQIHGPLQLTDPQKQRIREAFASFEQTS